MEEQFSIESRDLSTRNARFHKSVVHVDNDSARSTWANIAFSSHVCSLVFNRVHAVLIINEMLIKADAAPASLGFHRLAVSFYRLELGGVFRQLISIITARKKDDQVVSVATFLFLVFLYSRTGDRFDILGELGVV